MEPPARPPSSSDDAPDSIGAHAKYLRGLARALLRGQGWEEDVVQQAWMASLVRPEGTIRSPRAWLAGAVRHLSRRKLREEARRVRREQQAAMPERISPPQAPSARVEALRQVLDALDTLADPYRGAIVRRYLEDQSPREIAEAAGVAESTVRVWIHRGLKQLRETLDPEDDDARRAFLFALAPTAGVQVGALKLGVATGTATKVGETVSVQIDWTRYGWWIMNGKALLSIATAAVIGVSLWIWTGPETTPVSSTPSIHAKGPPLDDLAPHVSAGTPQVAGLSSREVPSTPPVAIAGDWIVRGMCVLPSGDPAPGVPIRLRRLAGIVLQPPGSDGMTELDRVDQVSAEDGTFRWPLPDPQGAVSIEAIAAGPYHSLWKAPYVLAGAEPEPIRLTVYPRDATVHGVVVDRHDAPIPGATVTAFAQTARTDHSGKYALPFPSGLDPNWSYLTAHADGHAYRWTSLIPPRSGESVEINLKLLPEGRIAGVVRDDDGDPIEGVTVWSSTRELNATTDVQGHFELGHLDPTHSRHYLIDAEKAGYLRESLSVSSSGPTVATPDGRALLCDITLSVGTPLRGRVSDPQGRPIHGARVVLEERDGRGRWTEITGQDGMFHAQVARAAHKVVATFAPFAPEERIVDVSAQTTVRPLLEFTLQSGHFVGGRVVNELGKPIASAIATIGRGSWGDHYVSATTDEDGRFRADGLLEGSASLSLQATGHASLREAIAQLDTEHYLWTLRRAAPISGLVVDGRTGLPITNFRIRILWTDVEDGERAVSGYSSIWAAGGVQFHSEDGRFDTGEHLFEVGAVASLQALAHGYAPSAPDRIVVTGDPKTTDTTLRLFPTLTLRGQVVQADTGAPIGGAFVREHDEQEAVLAFSDSSASDAAITDADGRFVMHLGSGVITLRVDTADGRTHIDDPLVLPQDGIPHEHVIRVGAFGWIEGTLIDGAGNGLGTQKIVLRSASPDFEDGDRETETDATGAFRFDNLNRGPYYASHVVQIEGEEVRAHTVHAVVQNGLATCTVLKPDGTASIRGAIRWDRPIPHLLRVTASARRRLATNSDGGGTASRAVFAIDGQFQIDGLREGDWKVEAFTWKDERLFVCSADVEVEVATTSTVQLTLAEDAR